MASKAQPGAIPQQSLTSHLADAQFPWLEPRTNGKPGTSVNGYRSIARARLEPALGTVKLRQLTAYQLDDLYVSLLDAGLSPVYVRHCHATLAAALRQAIKWDWIDRSPTDRASPPGATPPEVGPPDAQDVSRLITSVEKIDPDMASMLFVAATTGCRRGELCELRWSDLDVGNHSRPPGARGAIPRLVA